MLLQLASLFTAIVSVLAVSKAPANSEFRIQNSELGGVPQLAAQNAFLVDTVSGTVFHAKDADRELPIASITKLATALIMLEERPEWSRRVTFEARDRRNGDIAYLLTGEEITLQNAWNLMLTASSNDATMMLVRTMHDESLALSAPTKLSFVELMNEKARAWGLRHTHFADPTGLHPENVSTAREVAALARLALGRPEIRQALLAREYTFVPTGKTSRRVRSTNQLLSWFRPSRVTLFGGKTGHIEESGYNLVFAAGNRGHELIGVVLGSTDNDARFQDMSKLLSWGFSVVQEGQSLAD